uniref:Uncharacterized protein n=1 Tax=Mycena chlorophos TaxID=658473 RepID=A0ABQ0MDC1_MYCCL|nr:predicted protein [Mycena chlorophos]
MGGHAFSATLPEAAFPRIPPPVYEALKKQITPKLESLFQVVSTPAEAPQKADHGDVDFLVCQPLEELTHKEIQALLAADHVLPAHQTSSYALRVERGAWGPLGLEEQEDTARTAAEAAGSSNIYYQVDVHVCPDRSDWERVHFFHSYGDLGMILGLIVRNNGLTLGTKGLKLPNVPHPPIDLCDSMDEIMKYMGLSMDRWKAGFTTALEVFEWVGTSTFFDPTTFQSRGTGIKKVKPERKMYGNFVEWAEAQPPKTTGVSGMDKTARAQHALVRFGKKEEYDRIKQEDADRELIKAYFNGHNIREWTGIPADNWWDVKKVSEGVRAELGGPAGILALLEKGDERALIPVVRRVYKALEIEAITAGVRNL